MQRLYSLDYLRGFAALSILAYHFHLWETPSYIPQADSFLDRMGLYGVALFYILSGYTLARVYDSVNWQKQISWIQFFKKRLFRILPLLILVSLASALVSRKSYDLMQWFLNLTGLFGYFDRDAYIATGAWSIGNELVFYGLFPFLMFLAKGKGQSIVIGIWLLLWLLIPYFYLRETVSLPKQWNLYIHPLYQALFFMGGIVLSIVPRPSAQLQSASVFVGLVVFIFFPVWGGHIDLVVDTPKVILSSACLLVVFGATSLPPVSWKLIHWVLKTLGDWSYGIYLWHPLVYIGVNWFVKSHFQVPVEGKLGIFLSLVLLVSGASYHGFEKHWVRWGK